MGGDSSGVAGGALSGAAAGSALGPIGAIGGAILGAAGSFFSGRSASKFAERSYKRRYQWQVQDLKKAGLNPMLAVTQGAPNVPQPNFPNIGESAVKSGATAFSARQQAELTRAQILNLAFDTDLKNAQAAAANANAKGVELDNAIKAPVAAQSAQSAEYLLEKQAGDAAAAIHAAQTSGLDVVLKSREVEMGRLTIEQQQALQRVEIAYKTFMAEQARLGISEKAADAKFWDQTDEKGKWLYFLKQMIK